MTAAIRFVDEAVKEVDDAVLWYEDRREGLGLAFLAALDRAIESITRRPQAAALIEDVPEDLEIRRISIRRFPYFVAYLVLDGAVVVLAVAHERRRPGYWSERLES